MKKIWLMLLLISSVCAFTACSDDDDDKGENNGINPITELYLSDEIETGASTTVLGKGFTADAQIFVENIAGERTKIENVVVSATGITFTLPVTIETGVHVLILKQNNGEWNLGIFKALKMEEVNQLKKFSGKMWLEGEEADPFLEQNFDMAYDEYGKLKSMSSTSEVEGEDGNLTDLTQAYEFTYSENQIDMGGSFVDNEYIFPLTYTLKEGKIVKSKTKIAEFAWGSTEATIVDAEYTWNYDGDYLKSLTGTQTINYNFENGNLINIGEDYEFTYGDQVNHSTVDIVTWSLFLNDELTLDQFMAYMLGGCGKISANLPTYTTGECDYKFNEKGLVSEVMIKTDMGGEIYWTSMKFDYETVKVIVE